MDLFDGHALEQVIGSAVGGAVASLITTTHAFRAARKRTAAAFRWLFGLAKAQGRALHMRVPSPPEELAEIFDEEHTNPGVGP